MGAGRVLGMVNYGVGDPFSPHHGLGFTFVPRPHHSCLDEDCATPLQAVARANEAQATEEMLNLNTELERLSMKLKATETLSLAQHLIKPSRSRKVRGSCQAWALTTSRGCYREAQCLTVMTMLWQKIGGGQILRHIPRTKEGQRCV